MCHPSPAIYLPYDQPMCVILHVSFTCNINLNYCMLKQ